MLVKHALEVILGLVPAWALAGMAATQATNTPQNIFSKILPAIRTNIPTCGLITVCNAVTPLPSELESIFLDGAGNYRVMEGLFMYQLELNACQIIQSNLFKFLTSNAKVDLKHKISAEMISSGLYRIRPYILAKRINPINNNYWNVAGGTAVDLNGTPDANGVAWQVTVTSPTNIPMSAQWFNQPERVFIRGLTGGGSMTNTAWLVANSVLDASGSFVTLTLQSQNLQSFLPTVGLTSPVTGLLMRGTANVADFESFCQRGPGLITSNLDEFWIETTRDATCEDELYLKWRELVYANNPLYAQFFDLPTVEYNKQSGEDFQRRFVDTFFWNKALQNQTIQNVELLQDIYTVPLIGESGTRCVGKRANAIGVYEQHAQLNRIVDLQGGQLNLPALFEQLYYMQRVRRDSGANPAVCNVFEIMMPSQFFPSFNQAMLKYYKDQSNGMLQLFQDVNAESRWKESPMGFVYTDFPLIYPMKATLRVVTDLFFDDWFAANYNAGNSNAGRVLWIMDWSRIYMGLFASDRVVNKTGDLKNLAAVDPTFACVMRVPTRTTVLTSWMWTCICECPQGNLILENFSGDVPEPSVKGSYTYPLTTTSTTTTSTSTSTSTTSSTTLPSTTTLPSP